MPKQREQDRRRRSESSEDRKERRDSRPRSRSPEESQDQKQKEEDHGNKKPEEDGKKPEEEGDKPFEEETEASSSEASESEDKEKDPEHEPEEATASKSSEAAASKPSWGRSLDEPTAPDSPMSSASRRRLEEKLAQARVAAAQAALQSWAEEEKARKDKKEKKKQKMEKEKKEKDAKKNEKDREEQKEKEADDKAKEADERPHNETKEKKAWDGPKGPGPSKKCGVCWRWIQEHMAARRQHKLSVYHRTWKYIGQGLSKEAAAARAKRRFHEHWQPGRQEESEEESEVPKWELRRDSSNKGHEGYGYGDVRGGSGPSGAKAHAQNEKGRPEQAKTKGSKKRKKPAEGETISLIETEDDKEDRKPVRLLPRMIMPAKAGKTGKDTKSKGSKAKAKRKRQESPPWDWDHVPMPDKKDPEDPEGPDSYGKAVTTLFQIACGELRQRY